MFKNKNPDGTLNLCGRNVTKFRKKLNLSQRKLADELQLLGLDVTKNTIQQIESGKRFVTDIELDALTRYFNISADQLIDSQYKN